MKDIKSLIKNPIGIIGLFISFVYAIASLILGVGIKSLSLGERIAFIVFIICLPIYVFYHFVDLVKNHHKKLYGPGDFKTDDAFLNTIDKYIDKTIKEEKDDSKQGRNRSNVIPGFKIKFGIERPQDFRAYTVLYFLLIEINEDERKTHLEMLDSEAIEILQKMEADLIESKVIKTENTIFLQ